MKQAFGFASKILFFVLIGVLLVLNASYTMSFVSKLFPDDWIKVWGSLILFDLGAIVWFLVFLTWAEGAGQRGTALLMGIFDLLGSLVLAGAEVFSASEQFLSDRAMVAWLRETATYVLFVWLGVNIAATWLYHVVDPKQKQDMAARNIQDEMTARALEMVQGKVNQMAPELADEISERMFTNILAQLSISKLPPGRQIIDAKPSSNGREYNATSPAGAGNGVGGKATTGASVAKRAPTVNGSNPTSQRLS